MALALGGFGNAPVTKGLLIATAGASILHQSARSGSVAKHAVGAASRVLVFRHPGELLLGVMLIYYFRSLERRAGSSKFACFVTFTTGLSLALQAVAAKYAHIPIVPTGPYGYIFASFAQYYFDYPSTSHFMWKFSNKTFFYMAGLQLLTSGGLPTVLLGASGLFAGLLYRLDVLGIKRLKMPGPVSRLCNRFLGPFLTSPVQQVIQPGSSSSRRSASRVVRGAAARPAAAVVPPPQAAVVEPSPEAVETLLGMGFERQRVERALVATSNDIPAALELLVS
mmetsp:Transcript_6525/g.17492  ORF Transcript_6525/g.17492 Transcript_6525/m.17492 type:complete len:281 (-) Transcript_6525:349-1191(-)|eukprot:CAMPEP_0202357330 /NCGR_PEP_ID=MMETSP1126-20121109/11396_1 /ASSEMBLY_ACC=CAM_ASM_000457 /TAXON_ID=3047 /ORGANISM="Dunaliella tertiolecta, Strain CCMP1320" /LENGTH=280 /DNA_ID=CAMNT_0048950181 /DNA_START=92 /DNA_END=934 /DNA_ORIENTATION=-